MQVWIVSFVVLFALYESWDWLSRLELPLPMFVVGGLFLAIVSNYDKRGLFPGWPQHLDLGGEAIDETTEPASHPIAPTMPPVASPSEDPPRNEPISPVIRSPRLPFEQ